MDEAVCAIRPGTDVGRYARLLARTHDALLSGDRPPVDPRRLVARSWLRVQAQGVDPDRRDPPGPLDASQVEQRRTRSPLLQVLPALRAALTAVAEDARHVMVVTDADGVLLWREGSTRVRHRADALGFTEGARWTEGAVGTNAIGTALAEDAPVQIFSAEHFVRTHHGWTCTACPVHDPRSGELLGVVDVSGPAETVHPTTVALVSTAVKLAEAGLWRFHEHRLDALRSVAVPVLASGSGPGLVVDDHGWVAAVRGMPHVDRVAAPTADGPVAVHGLGLCVPEPVPGGWLLRPGGTRPRAAADPRARRPPAARRRRRHQRLGPPAVDPARRGAPAAGPRRAHRHGRRRAEHGALRPRGQPGDDPRRGLPAAQGDRRDPPGPALPAGAGGRGRAAGPRDEPVRGRVVGPGGAGARRALTRHCNTAATLAAGTAARWTAPVSAVTSGELPVVPGSTVGIVANPMSGRDIRRLVAQASVFPNAEKTNMVVRLLAAAGAAGVERALLSTDGMGVAGGVVRALAKRRASAGRLPDLEFVELNALTGTADDTRALVAAMRARGAGVIVTLGGDGTVRAAAATCGDVPLLPLSTGTNNAFPEMWEATVAGTAAGLLATGRVDADAVTHRSKVLHVECGPTREVALVDVCVSTVTHVGSKALWQPATLRELYCAFAEPHAIGLSSIAGLLHPAARTDPHGVVVTLADPATADRTVLRPDRARRRRPDRGAGTPATARRRPAPGRRGARHRRRRRRARDRVRPRHPRHRHPRARRTARARRARHARRRRRAPAPRPPARTRSILQSAL